MLLTYLLNGEILLFIRTWPSQQKRALGDRTRYSAVTRQLGGSAVRRWRCHSNDTAPLVTAHLGRRHLSLIIKFYWGLSRCWSPIHGDDADPPFIRPDRKCDDLHQLWQLPHQFIDWTVTAPTSIYWLNCDSSHIRGNGIMDLARQWFHYYWAVQNIGLTVVCYDEKNN